MKKKPAAEPAPPAIPIREIRGQRVLLDSDLAAIYGVPTSSLNQAVKRNRQRFPADFIIRLTREEVAALRSQDVILDPKAPMPESLAPNSSQIVMSSPEMEGMRSQIVTASREDDPLRSQTVTLEPGRGQHRKYLPYAFTEHGALQAANILRSPRAVAMSVFVIRAFVQMRATLLGNSALAAKLAELEARLTGRLDTHEHAIVHVMQQLVKLLASPSQPPPPPKPKIGFKP